MLALATIDLYSKCVQRNLAWCHDAGPLSNIHKCIGYILLILQIYIYQQQSAGFVKFGSKEVSQKILISPS